MKIIKLLSMLLILGCMQDKEITDNSVIGTWHSKSGEKITFNQDHTFTAENIESSVWFPNNYQYQNMKLTLTGKWILKNEFEILEIKLSFDSTESFKGGYVSQLYIRGLNGFFENKPPWVLFFWIGEPGEEELTLIKSE
jgi:hypothetical protein